MFYQIAEKALALEKKGKKITRLNVGDTNIPTPKCAVDAAVKAAKSGKSAYVSSAGIMELRDAIARREGCGIENVVVGPGSKHLIYGLLSVLAPRGGNVAFPAPYWPAYMLACKQLGLNAIAQDARLENNWEFGTLPKADVAVICNPLNPTSTIYSENSVKQEVLEANANGTYLLLDEAYKGLAFEKIPRYDGAIRVRSFSKEFNMENWRLGYVVAPEALAKKMIAFNQVTATCVSPISQAAGLACLENEREILEANRKIWKSRMDTAAKEMKSAGFEFAKPKSGMYVFARHDGIKDATAYALELLEKGVAVSPGADFGAGKGFIRVCANQDEGTLKSAIRKMGEEAR
ncbi:MAG TPA: pyridoxal phosphate-dependent aminotransferase [Candidatus Micrarchaeota archaeon]|nr:pyridoxal phosphate-dependent aminotransferase [Candidatus Micrarchaeota archaeon]